MKRTTISPGWQCVVVFAVTLFSAFPSDGVAQTFSDDFEAAVIDPFWDVLQQSVAFSCRQIRVTPEVNL